MQDDALAMHLQTPQGPVFVRIDTAAAPTTAPPLVLLHALGTDMSIWSALAQQMQASRTVIRIDAPGHGQSPAWPAGTVTLHALARSVVAALEQVGTSGPLDMLGTSMGAVVALQAAEFAPAMVRRLVLVGALLVRSDTSAQDMRSRSTTIVQTGMGPLTETMLTRWFPPRSEGIDEPAMAQLRALMLQTDPHAYAACSDALASYELSQALRAHQHNSLLIAGADDGAIPEQFAQMQRDMPALTLVTMAETGHFPHLQRPLEFTDLVTAFLGAKC